MEWMDLARQGWVHGVLDRVGPGDYRERFSFHQWLRSRADTSVPDLPGTFFFTPTVPDRWAPNIPEIQRCAAQVEQFHAEDEAEARELARGADARLLSRIAAASLEGVGESVPL